MRSSLVLVSAFIVSLQLFIQASPSRGEGPSPDDDTPDETKKLNELIEKSVDWYDVAVDPSFRDVLAPKPVLRWRNVARKQDGEAMMVIWCHRGRPEAMASIYPWLGNLHHEFASLARTGRVLARDRGAVVWSPTTAGVEFRDLPGGPEFAESPAARLRQMKAIAERFSATMTGWKGDNSDREELRLLPRALYRYDLKEAGDANPALRDGALFAFVLGTDPEVVLVLEAIRRGDDTVWQYAFARATSGGLEARLEGKSVWVGEKFPPNHSPTSPQITLGRPIPQ
jgi:hypothetical protein